MPETADFKAAVREFLSGVYAACGEDAPQVDDAAVEAALKQAEEAAEDEEDEDDDDEPEPEPEPEPHRYTALPAATKLTRLDFHYQEASPGSAARCGTCRWYHPKQANLGECGLYTKLMAEHPEEYNLLPDVGPHAVCDAWQSDGREEEPQRYTRVMDDDVLQYAEEGNWITLGGKEVGDKKHVGGFPAKIGKDGTIEASRAPGLQGKKIGEVKEHFEAERGKGKTEGKKEPAAEPEKPALPTTAEMLATPLTGGGEPTKAVPGAYDPGSYDPKLETNKAKIMFALRSKGEPHVGEPRDPDKKRAVEALVKDGLLEKDGGKYRLKRDEDKAEAAKARPAPKPLPSPEEMVKLPVKGKRGPRTSKRPAESAVAPLTADPMHGHPLAGLPRDEQHMRLAEQVEAERRGRGGMKNAADFAGYTPPQGPGVAAKVAKVIEAQSGDKYQPPSLQAVYETTREAIPSLTIPQFQGVVARLRHEDRAGLVPHTRAMSDLERPEHALPLGGEINSHVRRPPATLPSPADMAKLPLTGAEKSSETPLASDTKSGTLTTESKPEQTAEKGGEKRKMQKFTDVNMAHKAVAALKQVDPRIDAVVRSHDSASKNPDGTYTGEVLTDYSVNVAIKDPVHGNVVVRTIGNDLTPDDAVKLIDGMREEIKKAAKDVRKRKAIHREMDRE